jgi:STE24 endopeptidase
MHASMSKTLVLLTITFCFVSALFAASVEETPTTIASAGIQKNVQVLDPAAATQAWLDTVPRQEREKSDAYFEGGYWLILWNFLLAAAISIFLLASRVSARLRDFSRRLTRFKMLQVACYALPYLVIVYVLSFPLNLYQNFFREHHYGFATQTFLPWFREQLIGLGVAIVGGTILLVVLYAVSSRHRERGRSGERPSR